MRATEDLGLPESSASGVSALAARKKSNHCEAPSSFNQSSISSNAPSWVAALKLTSVPVFGITILTSHSAFGRSYCTLNRMALRMPR